MPKEKYESAVGRERLSGNWRYVFLWQHALVHSGFALFTGAVHFDETYEADSRHVLITTTYGSNASSFKPTGDFGLAIECGSVDQYAGIQHALVESGPLLFSR